MNLKRSAHQNEAERKALIDAILNGEPLDVTKDDPPGVLY